MANRFTVPVLSLKGQLSGALIMINQRGTISRNRIIVENPLNFIVKLPRDWMPQGPPNAPVLQQWALTNARASFYLPIRLLTVSASKDCNL